jgi:hypothetical protein
VVRVFLILILLTFSFGGHSQKFYRGIVVDSVTFENLPDVHITIKNSGKGVISNAAGSFQLYAKPTDTLLFTALGYKPLLLPLLFEEDVIMVMLKENIEWLAGVTITSTRLYPNKIEERTREAPKIMDPISGVLSPFDYFWREERDRRKLDRYVRENNRTQTYRQVMADPDVKKILMDAYNFSEEKYFRLLVLFNQRNSAVHYFTDPDEIMEALHKFMSAFRAD